MSKPPSLIVPPESAGLALDALVREAFQLSWSKARDWIGSGKIAVNGKVVTDTRFFPSVGAEVIVSMNAPRVKLEAKGAVSLVREQVVYVDSQIVVVNKASGISTVPFESTEQGSLQSAVERHLNQRRIEVVHRLDKETSGLLVFARTLVAAKHLANQFRFHSVSRRYLALAHGQVESRTIRSTLIEDRGDGLRGTARAGWRVAPGEGQEAITHVRAIQAFQGATLVECRLETGRTHQIRIHLSEQGHPLLGERLYIREFQKESLIPAVRVMLHATELGLIHPSSGQALHWESPPPQDFASQMLNLSSR